MIKINTAIVLAAGKGSRMKAGINKQFLELEDKPVIAHTLEVFNQCDEIEELIVVTAPEELDYFSENIIQKYHFNKIKKLVAGGAERQESAYRGIKAASEQSEILLIHDGARPFVSRQTILDCIREARHYGAASAGMPSKDTIKLLDEEGFVKVTPPRSCVWLTQTPQAFQRDILLRAHEEALARNAAATDDAMLAELLGYKVKMVEAAYENIKITTPEDLIIAAQLINRIHK